MGARSADTSGQLTIKATLVLQVGSTMIIRSQIFFYSSVRSNWELQLVIWPCQHIKNSKYVAIRCQPVAVYIHASHQATRVVALR